MKKYCVGIDVGGTTIKLGVFRTDGELLTKWEIPTRRENKGINILSDIAQAVKDKLAELSISMNDIEGAGIGVPGPTMENGYVIWCVNLGWKAINPAVELEKLLGVPVKAGNDANVAALGETWKGGAEGCRDVVLLTLGTGVGGGVILKGEMVAGKRGLAGEFGHITVDPKEEAVCSCGNHGCLEQYASATGVVRVMNKILAADDRPSVLRENEKITAKDVFDAAKNGDTLALEAVETLGQYLGQLLATVALTVDPDIFVLGGGVSRAGSILTDVVSKYYRKFAVIAGDNIVPVVLAKLGNDAGIYGAARMVLG